MEQYNVPEDMKLSLDFEDLRLSPALRLFRPLVFLDGETYYCVLGPDPESGVTGKGMSLEEAIGDWETNLRDRINHHRDDDELAYYLTDTLKTSPADVW